MGKIEPRDPAIVMRLARLGSFHQSRLSFMRILTRRLAYENWQFECKIFDIDENGVGHAVYSAIGPERTYSLIAFAHDLPPEKRSDRVIAEAWDATFALFDGVPSAQDIDRLSQNIPYQEAGRVRESELSVSRANRSVRLWDSVVSALASGEQPRREEVEATGYLMRTTAVYGSGKLGAADREMIAMRPEFAAPFQVEMLSVYLTRWFVRDLVQHMAEMRAKAQGRKAAKLLPELARILGIGNSTGLGMAPFLLNHPQLFHNWIAARERALTRIRETEFATENEIALFRELVARSRTSLAKWNSQHPIQIEKLAVLRKDAKALMVRINEIDLQNSFPWDRLYSWSEAHLSFEGQEWLVSLMLEPYGAVVDEFATTMAADEQSAARIDGAMTLRTLRAEIEAHYAWALEFDWRARENISRAWYVSEEKLEPRLGERFEEPIEAYEEPLAPARDIAALYQETKTWETTDTVAAFLRAHPEHRHSVRRVQIVQSAPYAEIRDNTVSADVLPIDMLRCKLSFFGATQFDPRSDRWVRICMFGGAPYPNELTAENVEFWVYPDNVVAAE